MAYDRAADGVVVEGFVMTYAEGVADENSAKEKRVDNP